MSYRINKVFACPYYVWDGVISIYCEGGRFRLPERASADEYIEQYCCDIDGWRRCTLARALNRHYERKEGLP